MIKRIKKNWRTAVKKRKIREKQQLQAVIARLINDRTA